MSRQFDIYGVSVAIDCHLDPLTRQIQSILGIFGVQPTVGQPARGEAAAAGCSGRIQGFSSAELIRRLPPTAKAVHRTADCVEIYQEGERFWSLDERWGISEINLLRGQWQSWVLPRPALDPFSCFELAVLWPLAQLMASRGVQLLPAASVEKNGSGTLIISPFGLRNELAALRAAEYRIVGQRWTALREQGSETHLLHLPGRTPEPAVTAPVRRRGSPSRWIDLAPTGSIFARRKTICDTLLIVAHGRRLRAHLRELPSISAAETLRQAWPLVELRSAHHASSTALRLTRSARCCEIQLSRRPEDLHALLRSLKMADVVSAVTGRTSPAQPRQSRPVTTTVFSGALAAARKPPSAAIHFQLARAAS